MRSARSKGVSTDWKTDQIRLALYTAQQLRIRVIYNPN